MPGPKPWLFLGLLTREWQRRTDRILIRKLDYAAADLSGNILLVIDMQRLRKVGHRPQAYVRFALCR